MTLSLRTRLLLTVSPIIVLIAGVGVAGVFLLRNLGHRSEDIIRENVVSLQAVYSLHQTLTDMERVALWAVLDGEPLHPDKPKAFQELAERARHEYRIELANITVPGEQKEAEELAAFVELVIQRGEKLLLAPAVQRRELYVHPDTGFQRTVSLAWMRLSTIWTMNEDAIHAADRAAKATARWSAWVLGITSVAAVALALVAVWWLHRTILDPIRSVTDAATAIGRGQLHQMVPVQTHDEIGRLAEAFNAMTAKLRAYRQTDTERLIRARQTGQATIDSFTDPVVVIDTLGRIETVNPAAQRVLGLTPPHDDEQHVPWTPPESLRQSVENALRQQRPVLTETFDEAVTFRLDGEDRVYLPQLRPIRSPDGEPLGAAVVLNDVTRFRILDRLKSDWVATVSHELKTPLTSVRLAVHVLLEEVVGPLEPKQVELLIEARESTERLLKLIEHLLALAKLEDGREQLDRRPTDPMSLLRAAADNAAARAEDKRIEVMVSACPELPPVSVDAIRFGRALNNLLDNAITYTAAGGTVTLSATLTENHRVRLSVCDTGIGIPPEYLPHVFDRFFRVPGRDQAPGTGLGLAIVREIVLAHGGEI